MRNFFLIFMSGLILVKAIPAYQRPKRDVSHLDFTYLPPQLPPLNGYLPPIEAKHTPFTSPSREYLPPVAAVRDVLNVTEKPHDFTIVADHSGAKETAEIISPTNEYLPPAAGPKVVAETPERPTNEYLPPIQTDKDVAEIPLENNENKEIITKTPNHATLEESSGEVVESLNVMPQEAAMQDVDGYHYKKPDHIPDLYTRREEATAEYFPPLTNGVEGPANGESAVLENNGYRYRVIKRLF